MNLMFIYVDCYDAVLSKQIPRELETRIHHV